MIRLLFSRVAHVGLGLYTLTTVIDELIMAALGFLEHLTRFGTLKLGSE